MFFATSLIILANEIKFKATYSIIENSCGGILTSFTGILSSPHFPEPYPSNIECIWTIKATQGFNLEISFKNLSLVESKHCNEDYLEFRDENENGKLLGTYCGNKMPEEPLILSQRIWIKFRSLDGNTGGGFEIFWSHGKIDW